MAGRISAQIRLPVPPDVVLPRPGALMPWQRDPLQLALEQMPQLERTL